jgi:hypothetical protein
MGQIEREGVSMIQTAAAFAKAASSIGQMAEYFKPADTDPYAQAQKLVMFHLRSAARVAREIAEAQAKREESKG